MKRYTRLSRFGIGMAFVLGVVGVPARAALAAPPGPPVTFPTITPFSGTATLTYTSMDGLIPTKARADLARFAQTETFAVRDATHWRIDTQITAPTIESQDETIVSDGQHVVMYSALLNQASRLPGGITESGYLLSSLLLSQRALIGTTTAQFIALAKRNPQMKVQLQGQAQVAGQTADVLRISPLFKVSTGNCNSAKSCAKNSKGYGSATMWLDHVHGIVLRYQEHSTRKFNDGTQGLTYLVTSITYGVGPSDTTLAYVPPVAVVNAPTSSSSSGSGGGGPGARFQAPPGFINIKTPSAPGVVMTLQGAGSGSSGMIGQSSYATGIFRGASGQGFVYVEQRVRALGLPATSTAGNAQAAGSCQVWTGTYSDGLNWLAMMRGQIAILAVSDTLSQADLVRYAASGICTASITPPPSGREVRNTALDHFETEIDITRQILGWAIASAPTATDKSTLKTYDTRLESLDRTVFALRYGTNRPYSPPSFSSPQHHSFKSNMVALKGEVSAAKYQLAAAEAAVTSSANRQKLVQQSAVFDDLVRTVDAMVSA